MRLTNITTLKKKLEKTYKLRMNEIDWNFYHDQCVPRIGKSYKLMINEGFSQHDLKFISRVNREISNKNYHDQLSTSMSHAARRVDLCKMLGKGSNNIFLQGSRNSQTVKLLVAFFVS